MTIERSSPRAEAIFQADLRRIVLRTDRMFFWLLIGQWLFAIAIALIWAPRTWIAHYWSVHEHVIAAAFLGAFFAAYPLFCILQRPGARYTRHVIAVGQMLQSALLVHVTGGRIETHFHVFGSLALLAFYRDWPVLLTASAVVYLDHVALGFWFPLSVYGVEAASFWRSSEHAFWVIFEVVFLAMACRTGIQELSAIANRQAQVETTAADLRLSNDEIQAISSHLQKVNEHLEERVKERTQTLMAEIHEREEMQQKLVRAHEEIERSAASLAASESRARAVVELVLDCIITMDHEGNILEFNPAAEKTFGYRRADVIGKRLAELVIPPAAREAHGRGLQRYLATGEVSVLGKRIEVTALRADGTEFPIELAIEVIRQDGPPVFTGYLRDLTERKQAEERLAKAKEEKIMAEAASRAKNEFLSRTSHELRTPLNAILGFGQLLAMNTLTDDQNECVEQIRRGGKHLLGLINEVLDITRIEAGQMELSPEPVCVGDAFQEVLGLVEPLGAERRIRFRLDPAGANGHYVLADNQKLKQVLLNLLSNAVKYNRDQGEVMLTCAETAPGRLRLTVRDTGGGIPPEQLPRLFIPFDRLGAEHSGVEGSGLGLALSKSLVELMGGTLTVISAVGEGSTFCVELPQAEARLELAAAPAEHSSAQVAATGEGRTVLYIEDNLDNLRLVQRILAHRPGVQLLTAMQGSIGADLARQHRPDLILLDVHLPDVNGAQVLRRLRQASETQQIPVVVVSADATARQIDRLRAAGAQDYLTKPLDVARLLQVVDECLERSVADR